MSSRSISQSLKVDSLMNFPKPCKMDSLAELLEVEAPEKEPFVKKLKERVIAFFSNPSTLGSHTAKNCWYLHSAKVFLRKVHETR